jgi:cytochrome c556
VDRSTFLGQNGRALEVKVIRLFAILGASCVVSLTVDARQAVPQLPSQPAVQPAAAPTPAPKPLVPAAASSIASTPDAFYGQNVTVTASTDRILSPTTFVVDQDPGKSGEGGVLVITPELTAPLKINSYVTVIGEVILHDGRPAIRATSVIDSSMKDLAKRLLPPMTPDEEAFDQTMKRIGPAFAALRQAVAAAGADTAKGHAATLKQGFIAAEAFWKKRDKPDAAKWALDARLQAETLERAVRTNSWDDARDAATGLQQTCSACHSTYRERQDDGSYRIRP